MKPPMHMKETASSQLKKNTRGESLISMSKLSGRKRSNNPNVSSNGPFFGVEYDQKHYESNQTEDKTGLKSNLAGKVILKTNSGVKNN